MSGEITLGLFYKGGVRKGEIPLNSPGYSSQPNTTCKVSFDPVRVGGSKSNKADITNTYTIASNTSRFLQDCNMYGAQRLLRSSS